MEQGNTKSQEPLQKLVSSDKPAYAKQVIRAHGRDKTVRADVADYLAPLLARREAKRIEAATRHAISCLRAEQFN